jgi:hypothetical protein
MKELKVFNSFGLEKRLQEVIQGKSHHFPIGESSIVITFDKSENGDVSNVEVKKNRIREIIDKLVEESTFNIADSEGYVREGYIGQREALMEIVELINE